jgi:hypothetical protein
VDARERDRWTFGSSVDLIPAGSTAGVSAKNKWETVMSSTDTNEKPGKPGKPPAPMIASEPEGSQEAAPPATSLTPTRVAQMEAGLRAYQEVEQENETLRRSLADARQDIKAKDMEIASLRERMDTMMDDHATILNAAESRATAAHAERDLAVAEASALKAFLASMKAIWDRIPNGAKG